MIRGLPRLRQRAQATIRPTNLPYSGFAILRLDDKKGLHKLLLYRCIRPWDAGSRTYQHMYALANYFTAVTRLVPREPRSLQRELLGDGRNNTTDVPHAEKHQHQHDDAPSRPEHQPPASANRPLKPRTGKRYILTMLVKNKKRDAAVDVQPQLETMLFIVHKIPTPSGERRKKW